MCVRVLFIMCTYVAMCRCVQVPTEEQGTGSSGAGVRGSCELLYMDAEN